MSMGTPRKRRQSVSVSLDPEIVDQLEALALLEGVKRHVVIRRLIMDRLERLRAVNPEIDQLVLLREEAREQHPAGTRPALTVIEGGAPR